jgi:hypothetical protein
MVERVGGTPPPPAYGKSEPDPKIVALARDLKAPLQTFIDAIKNLSPTSARDDAALSHVAVTLQRLAEVAGQATLIR